MSAAPPSAERLHALDALRASALLLGIVLHGSLSFIPDLPATLWPLADVSQSPFAAVLGFVIHVFRMSVFFLVAGLLARALLHRLGARAFWRNRAARIALPLVLAWPVCFALTAAVVLWALARANGGTLPPLSPEMVDAGLNLMHLWFLYVLLWLYAIAWAVRVALRAIDPPQRVVHALDRALQAALGSTPRSLLLAVPIALALALQPQWEWRAGVPTPGYTVVPPAVPLFIYLFVFGIGWLLDRQRVLLAALQRTWAPRLAIGLVFTCVAMVLAASEHGASVEHPWPWQLAYAVSYALALVGTVFGLVGAGMRFMAAPSASVRYLADASYWMYIVHLPLVMALQTVLLQVSAPWWLKWPGVTLSTCALLLWSYRLWVRPTWIGALLNGARR